MEISGVIKEIEERTQPSGVTKFVVTIASPTMQIAFVEFRTRDLKNKLKHMKLGDRITCSVRFEGKISKHSRTKYNNIIAINL